MFVSLFILLHFSVKAFDSDDSFVTEVETFLSNPTSDHVVEDDIEMSDIDPTIVNGADNLEFPAFVFKSSGQVHTHDSISYTCKYDFEAGVASYGLRPGTHIARGLGDEQTSGSLRIETQEGCAPRLWRFNRGWRKFGTVKRVSATTVLIQWRTKTKSVEYPKIHLPPINSNAEPCFYNFQAGKLQIYQMMPQKCVNQVRITNIRTNNVVEDLPPFKYAPKISSKNLCKYFYVHSRGLPYWLRTGDHRSKTRLSMRALLKVKTRKGCIPRVLSYGVIWKPLGTVKEHTDDTTTYLIDWQTRPDTDIILHLPHVVAGKTCCFELRGGSIETKMEKGQTCSHLFSF